MSTPEATWRSSGSPDDRADGGRMHIEVIDLGAFKMKQQDQARCNDAHVGYVAAGRINVSLEGGEELDVRSGDVFVILPGHDAWTASVEPCVMVPFDEGASVSQRFNVDPGTAEAA